MMRTSDSCRSRARQNGRPLAAGGFSLLEMLVVLVLVATMTALVAPRLHGTVQAIATSGERAEVTRQVERLPLLARQQGRPIEVEAGGDVTAVSPDFPEGWKVRPITALNIARNGICAAANLRVEGREMIEEWSVGSPDCKVDHGD